MTTSTFRASLNGWFRVFASASTRRDEPDAGSRFVRQLNGVTQATSAIKQGDSHKASGACPDHARRLREERISQAIANVPVDMARALKPQLSAFRIMGASGDEAMQHSLDAIDRAAGLLKGGQTELVRVMWIQALNALPTGKVSGSTSTPPPFTD
jgi:hypothetical protein